MKFDLCGVFIFFRLNRKVYIEIAKLKLLNKKTHPKSGSPQCFNIKARA